MNYYQFNKITKFIDYRGKTPKKTEYGIPLITAKNIKFGYLSEQPKEFISEDDYDGWMTRGIPKSGDILFTTEAPLGNVCLLNTNEKRAFAQRAIIFQPISDDTYISKYLFYYLMSPPFMEELDSKKTGTTVKGIKSSILKKFQIPLPPLSEQQRIVSKLNLLFEKIDKSIALHQKNMDEADVFMGSVLNDVFGELEEKYPIKTVDEISTNVRYGYTDSAKDKGNAVFIRITDINENGNFKDNFVYVDIAEKDLDRFRLYKGDILVARSGATAGKVALFDLDFVSVFASYLIRIQPNNEMDSSFLFYFCHSPKYWEQLNQIKVGGAQPNVNATNLKEIKIGTPPLSIQQKVVKYLDEISEKIEKVKSVQKEKMDSLKALKASILDQAFRGEL